MGGIDSVLVVIDRESNVLGVSQKACVIARHFAARLEFFACDSEYLASPGRDDAAQAAQIESSLADHRRFLASLRSVIAADDLDITVSVGCEQPPYSGILRKVRDSQPDLVVRALVRSEDRRRASILQADEWRLARACPAPLLFTRGQPWRPAPRIAARLPEGEVSPMMRKLVLDHCERLATGCRGITRVLASVDLSGEFEPADVVVLPAPSAVAPQPGRSVIEQFIERMDSDFLLIPAQAA